MTSLIPSRRLSTLAATLLLPAVLLGCKSRQLANDDAPIDESFWKRSEERRQAVADRDTAADREANAALASLLSDAPGPRPERVVADSRPAGPSSRPNVQPASGERDPFLAEEPAPTPSTRRAPQPAESMAVDDPEDFDSQLAELRAELAREQAAEKAAEPSLDWADDVPAAQPAPTRTATKPAATKPPVVAETTPPSTSADRFPRDERTQGSIADEFAPEDFAATEPKTEKPVRTKVDLEFAEEEFAADEFATNNDVPTLPERPTQPRTSNNPATDRQIVSNTGPVLATPIDWSQYEIEEPQRPVRGTSYQHGTDASPTNIVPEPPDEHPTVATVVGPARTNMIVDSVDIEPRGANRSELRAGATEPAASIASLAPNFEPTGNISRAGMFEDISSGLPTTPVADEKTEDAPPSDAIEVAAVLPGDVRANESAPLLVVPTDDEDDSADEVVVPGPSLPLLVPPANVDVAEEPVEVAAVSDPFLSGFPESAVSLESVDFAEEAEADKAEKGGATIVWWFAGMGIVGVLVLVRARKRLLA